MIETAHVTQLEIPLNRPFRIARGETQQATPLILRLETNHHTGWGEAHPSPAVTGETPERTRQILQNLEPESLDPSDPEPALEQVPNDAPAARTALDAALLDLEAKQQAQPGHRLLGLPDGETASAATITLTDPQDAKKQAQAWIRRGYTRLKAKAGPHTDLVALLEAIQSAFPTEVRPPMAKPEIWIDANEAFTLKDLQALFQALKNAPVAFLEQPLPRDETEALQQLLNQTPVPILLDEAITTPEDIEALAHLEGPLGVNLKIQKLGGPRRAQTALEAASQAGLFSVIGCNIETGLGIATGALFAGSVKRADLDGNLFLAHDPFPFPRPRPGFVSTTENPGLGVSPDPRFADPLHA